MVEVQPERLSGTRWAILAAYAVLAASTQMLWLTFAAIDTSTARVMHVDVGTVGDLAAISLGRLSLEEVPGLVRVDGVFEPDPAAAAVYAPMYREFRQLYGRLHGMYARLNHGG